MNKIKFFALIIGLALIQLIFMEYFKFFGVAADLLLISVVIASLSFRFRSAMLIAVFAGLIKDAFAAGSFGLNTLLFPLWTFSILRLSQDIDIDNNMIRLALICIIAALQNIICGSVLIYLGKSIPIGVFLRIVFIGSIYTTIVFPLIYRISKDIIYGAKRA
ncbi:MAG: rod shape-determining protein MreD [Candidatus Omnitrophica bacterium]|nr:rod shape-determining protein MreD [Candidatus Omnitrophota bacterium]MBU1090549.1 rod shape-determining protein MreD [Candidatus Omnitrophota bacterium]